MSLWLSIHLSRSNDSFFTLLRWRGIDCLLVMDDDSVDMAIVALAMLLLVLFRCCVFTLPWLFNYWCWAIRALQCFPLQWAWYLWEESWYGLFITLVTFLHIVTRCPSLYSVWWWSFTVVSLRMSLRCFVVTTTPDCSILGDDFAYSLFFVAALAMMFLLCFLLIRLSLLADSFVAWALVTLGMARCDSSDSWTVFVVVMMMFFCAAVLRCSRLSNFWGGSDLSVSLISASLSVIGYGFYVVIYCYVMAVSLLFSTWLFGAVLRFCTVWLIIPLSMLNDSLTLVTICYCAVFVLCFYIGSCYSTWWGWVIRMWYCFCDGIIDLFSVCIAPGIGMLFSIGIGRREMVDYYH
jgi:hypothetical protein